ncbi:hypothetical protein D3C77_606580 [compost metagenome]
MLGGLFGAVSVSVDQLLGQRVISRQLKEPLVPPEVASAVACPKAGPAKSFDQQHDHSTAHDRILLIGRQGQILA